MAVSTDYANQILTSLFSNAMIGLSTTTPNVNGGNITEPAASAGYARVQASQGSFQANNGTVTNKSYVYFPEATDSWGTVTHLCIYGKGSGSSGDTLRYFGAFTTPRQITANSVPLFRPETLSISMVD